MKHFNEIYDELKKRKLTELNTVDDKLSIHSFFE